MQGKISDTELERIAAALSGAPQAAYATPIIYPWSVRNFEAQPGALRRQATDRLRLYVHIPFCNYRCTFCFYAVRAGAKLAEMERYVAALERELEWIRPGTELADLFVGGGTPTALPPDLLARVLSAILARVNVAGDLVHTVEASPESITAAHLRVLEDNGVRRISMGIESMNETVLDTVHRRHSAAQAREACRMVSDGGLILNIDLIYGLPGQTEDSFRRDLEAAAEAGVASVCLYALRLNRNTPVSAQLSADERFDLARLVRWRALATRSAEDLGFTQTHPFTFKRSSDRAARKRSARVGVPSDLLGVGMAARSQLGSTMYRNHERSAVYMERVEQGLSPVETLFNLDDDDRKTQYIAFTLTDGRPLARATYAEIFGGSIDTDFGERIDLLERGGLIRDDGEVIALTETGMLVYDRVLLCFYPKRAVEWLGRNTVAADGDAAATY